ncbi:hypothetical protein Hokovirus_2_222 [Hokovirus HKV1]|uniref:Uncharacterized protein n=1 Tax=Hokovirus HKV1 TaxID=1977638 RepID=A0A1V0SG48_9VIRU|nr:hypothetical protein Hokovirus_2_222 [Hokovirus HKV1]
MNYVCDICEYKTFHKTHYNRHLNSAKHKQKEKLQNNICDFNDDIKSDFTLDLYSCTKTISTYNSESINNENKKKEKNELNKNSKINEENENNEENTEYKLKYIILKEKHESLLKEYTKMKQSYDKMKKKINKVKKNNLLMSCKQNVLKQENTKLVKKYDNIENKIIKKCNKNNIIIKSNKKEQLNLNNGIVSNVSNVNNSNINNNMVNIYTSNAMNMINFYFDKAPPLTTPNCCELFSKYFFTKYKIKESSYINNQECTCDINCPNKCNKFLICPKNLRIGKELLKISGDSPSIKLLSNYISTIITATYVKEDKNEQSIWNSDVSRLSFIIRQIINNHDIWSHDKGGTRINSILIKPIIQFIKEHIKFFITHITNEMNMRAKPYVLKILPYLINKIDNYEEKKKNSKKYKLIIEDIKLLQLYDDVFIDKKNYNGSFYIGKGFSNKNINQDSIISTCLKYNDEINIEIMKTYSVLGLDYAKLVDINKNLDDIKLNNSILKKISPNFYINKDLIEGLVNNNNLITRN